MAKNAFSVWRSGTGRGTIRVCTAVLYVSYGNVRTARPVLIETGALRIVSAKEYKPKLFIVSGDVFC